MPAHPSEPLNRFASDFLELFRAAPLPRSPTFLHQHGESLSTSHGQAATLRTRFPSFCCTDSPFPSWCRAKPRQSRQCARDFIRLAPQPSNHTFYVHTLLLQLSGLKPLGAIFRRSLTSMLSAPLCLCNCIPTLADDARCSKVRGAQWQAKLLAAQPSVNETRQAEQTDLLEVRWAKR